MARLGIDVGTWSVAALLVDATGRRLVPDSESGRLWARSAVARGPEGGWLLGEAAEQIRAVRPDLYRDDLKRLLDSDRPAYLGGAPYQVVELLAQVIGRSVANARDLTSEPVDQLVLGVPVSFEGARSDALRVAAQQAGFGGDRVTLVSEPVAAARATLGHQTAAGTWLVFDLGGGTFDAALVVRLPDGDGELVVLDTAGDASIGGYLVDDAITERLRTAHDLPEPDDDATGWEESELAAAARSMKHQLTQGTVAYARNPYRTGPPQLTLTRADLADLVKPVAEAALGHSESLLRNNDLTWADLDGTILTGGATRSPAIAGLIRARTTLTPAKHPPELTTAHGLIPIANSGVPHPTAPDAPPATRSPRLPTGPVVTTVISPQNAGNVRCIRTITGHRSGVNGIAFSPDGAMLATASSDKTVRLWDPATGTSKGTLTGHTRDVTAVAFSPDGTILASSCFDTTIRLWNPSTGELQRTLAGHAKVVNAVAFSPDGTLLATGSDDSFVRIWDPVTGTEQAKLFGSRRGVKAVGFTPDGTLITTTESIAQLRDPLEGTGFAAFGGHSTGVESVAPSPDGSVLVTAASLEVWLWDVATPGIPPKASFRDDNSVHAVAFTPDGLVLVTASWDGGVRLWDPATGGPLARLTGHTDAVRGAAFSPDGTRLATASWDTTVRLWGID